MFVQCLRSTPFTTSAANGMFSDRITGDLYSMEDSTFLATIRALVYPRMDENEKLILGFSGTSWSEHAVESHPVDRLYSAMGIRLIDEYGNEASGRISIHEFCAGNDASNHASMDFVKRTFLDTFSGYHEVKRVTECFRKTFDVLCFVNPSRKNVCIFSKELGIKKMHYLQCAIPAFFPWYFNKEDGITQLERDLLSSLAGKSSEKYCKLLEEMAEKYDFETENIKNLLKGYEKKYEQVLIDNTSEEMKNLDYAIRDLNAQIMSRIKKKRDLETKLIGLYARVDEDSGESGVMDLFLSNKNIHLESVEGTRIRFTVKSYLEQFDPVAAETFINNRNSYFYRHDSKISDDDMEMLLRSIFIDQELKIRMCAAYEFDMRGNGDYGCSGYTFDYHYDNEIPNAHIQQYACLGNYSHYITEFVQDGDYVGAICQCIVSCGSLNVAEAPTMQVFVRWFYGQESGINNKCIELPDGRVVKPQEAIKYLKGELENE